MLLQFSKSRKVFLNVLWEFPASSARKLKDFPKTNFRKATFITLITFEFSKKLDAFETQVNQLLAKWISISKQICSNLLKFAAICSTDRSLRSESVRMSEATARVGARSAQIAQVDHENSEPGTNQQVQTRQRRPLSQITFHGLVVISVKLGFALMCPPVIANSPVRLHLHRLPSPTTALPSLYTRFMRFPFVSLTV